MATRSPVPIHNFWGAADSAGTPWTAGTLPNVAAPLATLTLQAGDFAYVAADSTFYLCTNPGTIGPFSAATWVPMLSGTASDKFAPKYLVGNTQAPYNDSPVAYSSDGFYYIPDTGNGAGIQTALAYANSTSLPGVFKGTGDVWIRPGVYSFDNSGGPAGPLTIPSGVRVQGAGAQATTIRGRSSGDPGVFVMEGGSSLAHLFVWNPTPSGSGAQALISIEGEDVSAEYVKVAASTSPSTPTLDTCILLSGQETVRVVHIQKCNIGGAKYGIRLVNAANVNVTDCQTSGWSSGVYSQSGSNNVRIVGCNIFSTGFAGEPDPIALRVDGNTNVVIGNKLDLSFGAGPAIQISGDYNSTSNNVAETWDATAAISLTGTSQNNVVIGNVTRGINTPLLSPTNDAGTTNEVAHNI